MDLGPFPATPHAHLLPTYEATDRQWLGASIIVVPMLTLSVTLISGGEIVVLQLMRANYTT